MKYETKVYNFFKVGDEYWYPINGDVVKFSAEQFACMDNQYQIMGYRRFDEEVAISFSKVLNEQEVFEKNFLYR